MAIEYLCTSYLSFLLTRPAIGQALNTLKFKFREFWPSQASAAFGYKLTRPPPFLGLLLPKFAILSRFTLSGQGHFALYGQNGGSSGNLGCCVAGLPNWLNPEAPHVF